MSFYSDETECSASWMATGELYLPVTGQLLVYLMLSIGALTKCHCQDTRFRKNRSISKRLKSLKRLRNRVWATCPLGHFTWKLHGNYSRGISGFLQLFTVIFFKDLSKPKPLSWEISIFEKSQSSKIWSLRSRKIRCSWNSEQIEPPVIICALAEIWKAMAKSQFERIWKTKWFFQTEVHRIMTTSWVLLSAA